MKRPSPTLKALTELRAKFADIATKYDIDLGPIPNDRPLESTPRYQKMLEERES